MPISSDIFGRLDWLTTRVKRLCCNVDQLKIEIASKLSSVFVDGHTIQGNGTFGNLLRSNLSNAYYQNADNLTVTLAPNFTFHYVDADPFGIATSCTIDDTNLTIEEGRRLIIVNRSGFSASINGASNLPVPGAILGNGETAEFVGIFNPFSLLPQLQWLLINVY